MIIKEIARKYNKKEKKKKNLKKVPEK